MAGTSLFGMIGVVNSAEIAMPEVVIMAMGTVMSVVHFCEPCPTPLMLRARGEDGA